MKRSRWTLGLAAALLATAAFDAAGQCENANTLADIYGPGLPSFPQETRVEIRPDQSNPGARALALAGAFLSSADDATSVVANPAGLGAMVRPAFQLEIRPADLVQYDRFGDGYVNRPDSAGDPYIQKDFAPSIPVFASVVFPVADKLVLAAFFQQFQGGDREVLRNGTGDLASLRRGPCYSTVTTTGAPTQAFALTYDLTGQSKIWRTGASFGFRATYQLTLGGTVYWVNEDRAFLIRGGSALGPDVTTSITSEDDAFGFIIGAQFTPSEKLRLGLVYSHEVGLKEDKAGADELFKETVLPMRLGFGLNFSPSSSLALSLEGVWVGTSAFKDSVNFSQAFREWDSGFFTPGDSGNPRDAKNWEASDSFEARFGLEWSVVQTRTTIFAVRTGYWTVSPSNLRYVGGEAQFVQNRALYDYLRITNPNVDDPWLHHLTGGIGAVFSKKFQVDVGVDWEFAETDAVAFSALVGYTF